jgi:hypothetical protein
MDELPPTAQTIRKYTMNLSGKLGSRPRMSAPSAPPRPARPEPTAPPTIAEQRRVLDDHFTLMLAVNHSMRNGEETSSRNIRKFGIRFSEHHPRREEVRLRVIAVETHAQWRQVLDDLYPLPAARNSPVLGDS